jgi:hypothetical protein
MRRKLTVRPLHILSTAFVAWGLLAWQSRSYAQDAPVQGGEGNRVNAKGQPGDVQDTEGYAGFIRRSMPPLPADAPQPSLDPHNLEGTWFHSDLLEKYVAKTMYGHPVPINAEGQKILDHRVSSLKGGKPIASAATRCVPPGHPWQLDLNMPFTVLDDKDVIYLVFEEFHGIWKIRMNQPHRAAEAPREYMGDSVGHWEGNTLVVDTTHFKAPMWIDVAGEPLSRDAHLIHRIRKIDEGGPALEMITTVDDPTYYASRWSMVRSFAWRPDKRLFAEYNCEEQVGAPDSMTAYGVIDEDR